MSRLSVPIIVVVTGEGGSGGALAIAVGDRVLMLEFSVYAVISPEGCAAILWSDGTKGAQAAEALKLTAKDIKDLEVIDEIVKEPLGGAHRDHEAMAENLHEALTRNLAELKKIPGRNWWSSVTRSSGKCRGLWNREEWLDLMQGWNASSC